MTIMNYVRSITARPRLSSLCFALTSAILAVSANAQVTTPEPIVDPQILVYFEKQGSRYCPVDVAFRGKVKTTGGTGEAVLPTGVPMKAPAAGKDNTVFWVAIDKGTMQPLAKQPAESKFKFAVFFHPFQDQDAFVSRWRNGPKAYAIGPKKLWNQERLPEGVEYKYTVVTGTDESGEWVVDTKCKPLDPRIRVL